MKPEGWGAVAVRHSAAAGEDADHPVEIAHAGAGPAGVACSDQDEESEPHHSSAAWLQLDVVAAVQRLRR